jgi:hypothetical protein
LDHKLGTVIIRNRIWYSLTGCDRHTASGKAETTEPAVEENAGALLIKVGRS